MTDPGGTHEGNDLNSLRADVTETTNVLKMTVEKLVQRGDNLDAMNARAQDLNSSSYYFRGTSRQLNRQMRWQNYRLTIFIVIAILIVLVLMILLALHPWKR